MFEAEFQPSQREVVLGTPVWVIFTFRNLGPGDVSFAVGHGRSDSDRFSASPPCEDYGVAASGPRYPYWDWGGLEQTELVRPGQTWRARVLLNAYLQFLRPGTYVVRCELDLDAEITQGRPARPISGPRAQRLEVRTEIVVEVEDDAVRRQAILTALDASMLEPGDSSARAAHVVARLATTDAVPIMARGLASPREDVVTECLWGLSRSGGEAPKEALRAFLRSSRWGDPLNEDARTGLQRLEGGW